MRSAGGAVAVHVRRLPLSCEAGDEPGRDRLPRRRGGSTGSTARMSRGPTCRSRRCRRSGRCRRRCRGTRGSATFGSHAIACWSACTCRVVPGRAAVVRLPQAHVGVEEVVLVRPGRPTAGRTTTGSRPTRRARPPAHERVAAVVGDEEALVGAVRRAGDDVDAVRVARRDRDADAAEARVAREPGARRVVGARQADDVLEPRPGVAAVVGPEQARADAAVHARAVVALVVPQRRVHAVGVRRVDRHVDAAGRVVRRREHQLPVLAAVGDPVDAALAGDAGDGARGRHEHAVRVGRVDRDAADRRAVPQAPVLPGRAAVGRLVDAVAEVRQAAARRVGLAGARPQRAVGAPCDRADRLRVRVGPDRGEGRTGVGALPDAAARDGDVDRVRLGSDRPAGR